MNSIKRIYLACRAAIAESGPLTYVLGFVIIALIATFIFFVSKDKDSIDSLLKSEFSFWNPDTIINTIVVGGWVASLIVCDGFYKRWFKEENQAVRTLTLPLSNGERIITLLLLYLVFVPLVCFVLPFLLISLLTLLAPDFLMLPSITYLWNALGIGFLANAAVCALWLQPSFAFGKKGGYVILAIIALGIFYISRTHGNVSETLNLPYVTSMAQEPGVVGLTHYEPIMTASKGEIIKIDYPEDETAYTAIQAIFILLMLTAGGLALTQKNS